MSHKWRVLSCSFLLWHLRTPNVRHGPHFSFHRHTLQPLLIVMEVRVQRCVSSTSAAVPGDRACSDELQHAVIATHSSSVALVCRQSALLQPCGQTLARSWPASRRLHLQLCPCRCTRAMQAGRVLLLGVQSMLGRPQLVTTEPFGLHAAAQAAAALCRAQCTHARHQWLHRC